MSQRIKSWTAAAARIFLGLIYFVFGLNFFFQFLGTPPASSGQAETFISGLFISGYFFPVLKGIEVVAGLALILGGFVPLALVILMPISINIFLFHVFLTEDVVVSILIVALNLYTAWMYRDHYKPLFQQKALVHW